jgi:hypothetical protein
VCLTRLCAAADFSADIVDGTAPPAKIYTADGKVRIETPEAASGFFLIDGTAGTALFVRPGQQYFTDARQSSRLTQLFVAVDPDNPCIQWQAAARIAGVPGTDGEWHCMKVGVLEIDGRPTTEWRVTSAAGDSSQRWIDSRLGFPVRMRLSDGAILALANVRVAAQSAELFAVPRSYRRLDPHALLERIKHSDVWVEPPAQ